LIIKNEKMKKIIILSIIIVLSCQQTFAQTKKMYVWIETESSTVFQYNTNNWKPEIPYKHFVRLISEVMEVPDDYYVREQFYAYIMKNYLPELKKMKLHKDVARMSIGLYDDNYGRAAIDYKSLFEPVATASWQFETILIKGFKYDPNNKGPWPLFDKAKKLVVEGKE